MRKVCWQEPSTPDVKRARRERSVTHVLQGRRDAPADRRMSSPFPVASVPARRCCPWHNASSVTKPRRSEERRLTRGESLFAVKYQPRPNDVETMDEHVPESQEHERRREPRIRIAGVAVLRGGAQPPSVWRVTNLSLGGAALVGDGALLPARLSLSIHVAGFPAVDVDAKVLRRQLVTRAGKCAVKFVDVSAAAKETLREILDAEQKPLLVRRRALIVDSDETPTLALASELASLGFIVRREASPEQAAAWLQREDTEVLLVGEGVVGASGWSLLEFVRDTEPEIRRFVVAEDVRGFRLYYAIKAGLVDGLIGRKMAGDALARHVLGAAPAKSRASQPRAARRA
jgi:hypothetical protein